MQVEVGFAEVWVVQINCSGGLVFSSEIVDLGMAERDEG